MEGGLIVAKEDFTIPRSKDYRRQSVYLKTMSKNSIVMSLIYLCASRQDSIALIDSLSD